LFPEQFLIVNFAEIATVIRFMCHRIIIRIRILICLLSLIKIDLFL